MTELAGGGQRYASNLTVFKTMHNNQIKTTATMSNVDGGGKGE